MSIAKQIRLVLDFLSKFVILSVNLIVPGMGYALSAKYRQACTLLLLLMLTTAIICLSRIIFFPAGLSLLLILILALPLASTVFLAKEIRYRSIQWHWKSFLKASIFAAFSLGIFCGGFISKHYWLGIHINFVPSPSMQPTLEPGDFILVDTWRYGYHAPAINDVVTFTSLQHEGLLVKRIQPWPGTDTIEQQGEYFVMGDNRPYSTDSRRFGGISREQIQGQVRLVLFSLDKDLSFRTDRWLQAVQ